MCGIAGSVGPGAAASADTLYEMTAAIIHRGPDADGYYVDEDVILGMRRLSIIDVDGGNQPIFNEDRSVVVVFNGEIYNYSELRAHLVARGHRFSTSSDTECIAHLYEDYGAACAEHLRGMFAFALWDTRRRRLVLARDRVGKKPLYYRVSGNRIWFASELKSLMAVPFERRVDPIALHHYLTYQYVPAPWSMLEGVQKLPPAHSLLFENGKARVERYWRLRYEPKKTIPDADVPQLLRDVIREAVGIRMVAERPVGAFLSGGIDSSMVVAMMAEFASGPIKTFSIGFEDPGYDERNFARVVAERFGTDHTEFVVRPSALDILDDLGRFYDEPFADSSAIPTFILSSLTREHVVVALNGDGGDESFGGYERYIATELMRRVKSPALRATAGGLAHLFPNSRSAPRTLRRAKRMLQTFAAPPDQRYAQFMCHFDNDQKARLYTDDMRQATHGVDSYELLSEAVADSDAAGIDRLLDIDVQTYLPGDLLVKVDIASMAHSLEARSPFLDHHLMEFAACLPAHLKLTSSHGRWSSKHVLKAAARGLVPDAVLDRKKMGFGVPMASWLRGELRDKAYDALCDHTARTRGYFRPDAVTQLLLEHEAGVDHSTRLWNLLQFELWHRRFIDRTA